MDMMGAARVLSFKGKKYVSPFIVSFPGQLECGHCSESSPVQRAAAGDDMVRGQIPSTIKPPLSILTTNPNCSARGEEITSLLKAAESLNLVASYDSPIVLKSCQTIIFKVEVMFFPSCTTS